MPTPREQVESAIETINDNGNNKAKEVRDVLNAILDYTENENVVDPSPGNLERFHFSNNNISIKDQQDTSYLWYSLIITPLTLKSTSTNEDHVPNLAFDLTLKFQVIKVEINRYSFKIVEDALSEFLRSNLKIQTEDILKFFVPITIIGDDSNTAEASVLHIGIIENTISVQFLVQGNDRPLKEGDFAYTSIRFHLSDFSEV